MQRFRSFAARLTSIAVALVACSVVATAQSTIFNAPSTDVATAGATYVEADFVGRFSSRADGGFQTYGLRAVHGLTSNVEVGVNAFDTEAAGPDLPAEIQPNAKWRFYVNEKTGVAATVGGVLNVPVTERAAGDTFGLLYTTVSKKVLASYGPRLTGGAYRVVGLADGAGTKGGVVVGFEQPLHSRVNLLADWFGGQNRYGYLGAGLGVSVTKRSLLMVGYNVSNLGGSGNGLVVFYGYTF